MVRRVRPLVLPSSSMLPEARDGIDYEYPTESSVTDCNFTGEIVLGHPMSIDYTDRFFLGSLAMMITYSLTVDHINTHRCGVNINDQNYSLALHTIGDQSNRLQNKVIVEQLANEANFFLGPYSSYLSQHVVDYVGPTNNQLVVTSASSKTSLHASQDHAFGIIPPTHQYYTPVLEATASKGARTVVYLYEESIPSDVWFDETFLHENFDRRNLTLVERYKMVDDPSSDEIDQAIRTLKDINPDVVIAGMYDRCLAVIESCRKHDWVPKALYFGNCIETLGD